MNAKPAENPLAPLAEAVAEAVITAKDVELSKLEEELTTARHGQRVARVGLNLVLRAGEQVRRAVTESLEAVEPIHGQD